MLKDELWSLDQGITGQKRLFRDLKEYNSNAFEIIKKLRAKRKKNDREKDEDSE